MRDIWEASAAGPGRWRPGIAGRWLALMALLLALLLQPAASAASLSRLLGVKVQAGEDRERIVFELDRLPRYEYRMEADGTRIVLDFSGIAMKAAAKTKIATPHIQKVRYEEKRGHLLVTIDLQKPALFQVTAEENPFRVCVDVLFDDGTAPPAPQEPSSQPWQPLQPARPVEAAPGIEEQELAPGLALKTYRGDGLAAYFLFADPGRYALRPALAGGQVPGRGTLTRISDASNAVGAVNASYFAPNGEILGIAKIDGVVAGTTYFLRSAMGILPDGRPVFGKVSYNGLVTLGGVSLPVSGVDTERGENNLVIYNRWYGPRTRTNEYGLEFVVRGDTVTAIHTGNSEIPADGAVVSVHGTSMAAFSHVRVGDPAVILEDLGEPWNEAVQILGAGPRLVENGQVHVTVAEEQFPGDIRYGRAPRSAAGVTRDGQFLLAVVDGRQAASRGCTLAEWAELLRSFGAWDAVNYDGGGSSELVVGGAIQNSPSDGGERPVGSAWILARK